MHNSLTKSAVPTIFKDVDHYGKNSLEEQCNSISHLNNQEEVKATYVSQVRKLCRLCVNVIDDSEAIHIFGKESRGIDLSGKINRLLQPEDQVVKCDYLPLWICHKCWQRLETCMDTINSFLAATSKLKDILKPVKWLDNLSTSLCNRESEPSACQRLSSTGDQTTETQDDEEMEYMEEEWLEEERIEYEADMKGSSKSQEWTSSSLSSINDSNINVIPTELLARETSTSSVISSNQCSSRDMQGVERNFLCRVCNQFYSSIDEVLLHRFKEHTQEDVLQARLKLQQRAGVVLDQEYIRSDIVESSPSQ